jgi:hypothetical protein
MLYKVLNSITPDQADCPSKAAARRLLIRPARYIEQQQPSYPLRPVSAKSGCITAAC